MKSKYRKISRREFIKKSSIGAAGLAGISVAGSCSPKSPTVAENNNSDKNDLLPKRTLGGTGLDVSMLSFGGGSQFMKNPDGEWELLLQKALDSGVNLFDTSVSYEGSEARYAEILTPVRKRVYICTKFDGMKTGKRNVDVMMKELETSLKNLKTDYVDILLLHMVTDGDEVNHIANTVYKKMLELKSEGTVKYIGFSSMDSAERSEELIEKLNFDVVLLALNATTYGNFDSVALPAANAKNLGVLAMKVMRNVVGQHATARELINYTLSLKGVASACIGHHGIEVFKENVQLVKNYQSTPESENRNYQLGKKLQHLAGPHALCWAHDNYIDEYRSC